MTPSSVISLDTKILYICGSLNQTTSLYKISQALPPHQAFFTPFYVDGVLAFFDKLGALDFTPVGGVARGMTLDFLHSHNLTVDYRGEAHDYDLVVTSQDIFVPKNILHRRVVLIQEGMTDPENVMYHLVKWFSLPRYLASTSTTGLSDAYDIFCVASDGYKDLFVSKGVRPEKIRVTGIPNFDHCSQFLENDFPHKNYVLVATSDARETYKYENRKKFIKRALEIANGRQVIFKLHPNEDFERGVAEINKWAPQAIVFTSGNTNHMIANCDVLITRFSTVVYVGIALGKEVHSEFDIDFLKRLTPIQNEGTSNISIANEILTLLSETSGRQFSSNFPSYSSLTGFWNLLPKKLGTYFKNFS